MIQRFYRKIIRIKGIDSPNVRLAMAQIKSGKRPTHDLLVPGVLTYQEYLKRRALWDRVRQSVALDAEFYEGAEVLMYPTDWLNRAEQFALQIVGRKRVGRAVGCDPAEGGDKTAMSVVDEWGLIEQQSYKTPDTSVIPGQVLAFARKWGVADEDIVFDRGGGGKEHADRLRAQGHPVRTVAFGEAITLDPKRGMTRVEDRLENKETHYEFLNRRAQMYGDLRTLLDPNVGGHFALPAEYVELRRQLSPIPLTYDEEGRLFVLPKNKKDKDSTKKTLTELLGCSPDEADSLVLAVHGMLYKKKLTRAGPV